MNTAYSVDEHMGSFVSAFVSLLADRVESDSRGFALEQKTPFGTIAPWNPEASAV